MDDDFNTPDALAVLQGAARELNQAKASGDSPRTAAAAATMLRMGEVLGILQQDPEAYIKRGAHAGSSSGLTDAAIEALLEARRGARAARNFAESDRIRDELSAKGVLLEDKPGGATEWRRV